MLERACLAQQQSQGLDLEVALVSSSHLHPVKGREVECAKGKYAWHKGEDT